jgi:hypothetical protein
MELYMKTLLTLFLFAFCAVVARAQEPAAKPAAPPAITVTKLKWSREFQRPVTWRGSDSIALGPIPDWFPSLESQPFSNVRREPTHSPFPSSGRLSYVYVYSAKVTNNSAQAIRAVAWDYVVSDPGSKQELSRHHFYSHKKIGKHSDATLRGRSVAPPSNIVTVAGLEKDKRSPYDERVEFKCVVYADGTSWQNPSAGESECFNLMNRRAMRRRPRP